MAGAIGGPADPPGSDRPPTRSFKPRRRRLSPARAAAYERLLADWSIAEVGPVLDLDAVFGRRAGVVLDIGFGGGEATIELAQARPDQDVLAIDVHTPGIARLVESIERDHLTNVRVIDGDALVFVERIQAASLQEIRILFPDPWPKVRQRHRRLVRADVVATLTDRLAPGGTLHIATDVADYASQVLAVCSAESRLAGGIVDRPVERTITRFEQRGIDAGRHAVDLAFTRR